MTKHTIEKFEFTEVIVRANPGVINSATLNKPLHMLPVGAKGTWSTQFDELPKLIVRMTLSDGTVGCGEFMRDHNTKLVKDIADSLLGVAIEDLSLQQLPILLSREYDGFECAIWDVAAKLQGLPLHKLLGGALQEKVKVTAWSSHRTLDEVGPWVRQYQDLGFETIKFKADLEDDVVGMCEKIAAHAPKMKVIFDPNQRFENLGETKKIVRGLEKVGNVMILEDPMPIWMLQDYKALREFTDIRIIRHISLPYIWQGQRQHDIINALTHQAVDGFNFNGGLSAFHRLAQVAHCANFYFWHGSEVDLGILEAMYVHQAAATQNCIWPSDIFGRHIRSHDLLKTPLKFEPPFVHIPQGPGLGIELDEDAISQFKTTEFVVG
ncbi:mandelate racemase/muconate lactonizing enzyme family protein [Pseudovibrio sp. Ad37]|uniref:mandelate racemase/muconate lactonizing enzyme family protein n=1 Tax=Pseudovibrio sp. Ad37 TaxID=989422 RepID=UPI0007AEAFD4|nr:mandelate racemase/muconate lactonizing enzyme family protein [Pseudovibrio sp. Ad37]KZL17854.1 Muconate cycloisomerase 1 [Pseudovibrio sp. Ad37]